MSHHFNSPAAKADGRLNLTDLYVFPTSGEFTTFVMNVRPDAGEGKSSPTALHPDATYDFNIDLDGKPGEFDAFNRAHPFEWSEHEREHAIEYLTKVVATTSSIANPAIYAADVVDTYVVPVVLPYQIGTPAAFTMGGVNGRTLSDNVYDVLMTRVTNRPIASGFEPCQPRLVFPYVNEPHRRTDIAPVIDRSQQ